MKTADMHCDTISGILERRRKGEAAGLRRGNSHLDLEKMKKGDYLLQNFAMFIEQSQTENPYKECRAQIAVFKEEMEKNKDLITQIYSYEGLEANRREGRMSALLTIEEGEACLGDLKKLHEFYDDGARMMTFTWNYDNCLATSAAGRDCKKPRAYTGKRSGLTETGLLFLEEMERIGMIADVSHLSDAGIEDVLAHARKPFVASHSNARTLCGHPRNLKDDHIRKMAEKGCVIGANYFSRFLEEGEDLSRVSAVADHIQYIWNLGGSECIGLGSDFDGIGCALEIKDASHMELLYEELHRRKISEAQIEKIFYKNVLQLYKERLGINGRATCQN